MTLRQACGAVTMLVALAAVPAAAQAVAGPEKARPVQGDPGISSLQVLNEGAFRVLRDYAEPGAWPSTVRRSWPVMSTNT